MDNNRLQVPGQQQQQQQQGTPRRQPQQQYEDDETLVSSRRTTLNNESNYNNYLQQQQQKIQEQLSDNITITRNKMREVSNKIRDGNRVVFMLKGSTAAKDTTIEGGRRQYSDQEAEDVDYNQRVINTNTSKHFPTLGESPAPFANKNPSSAAASSGQRRQQEDANIVRFDDERQKRRQYDDSHKTTASFDDERQRNRGAEDRRRRGQRGYYSLSEDDQDNYQDNYQSEDDRERRRRQRSTRRNNHDYSLERGHGNYRHAEDRRYSDEEMMRRYPNEERSFVRNRREHKSQQELEDEEDLFRERERRRRGQPQRSKRTDSEEEEELRRRRQQQRPLENVVVNNKDRYLSSDQRHREQQQQRPSEDANTRRQQQHDLMDRRQEQQQTIHHRGSLDRNQGRNGTYNVSDAEDERRRRRNEGRRYSGNNEFYSDDDANDRHSVYRRRQQQQQDAAYYRDVRGHRDSDPTPRTATRNVGVGVSVNRRDADSSNLCPKCSSISTNPSLPRPPLRTPINSSTQHEHYSCGHLRGGTTSSDNLQQQQTRVVGVGGGGGRKIAMIPPIFVPKWESIARNKSKLRLPFARIQDLNETPGIGLKLTEHDTLRNKRNLPPPPPSNQLPTSPTIPMARMRLLNDLVNDTQVNKSGIGSTNSTLKRGMSPIPKFNYEHFYNQIQTMINEQEKQQLINQSIQQTPMLLMQQTPKQTTTQSILRSSSPSLLTTLQRQQQHQQQQLLNQHQQQQMLASQVASSNLASNERRQIIGGSLPGSPSRLGSNYPQRTSSSLQLYSPSTYPLHVQYMQRSSARGATTAGHSLTPPPNYIHQRGGSNIYNNSNSTFTTSDALNAANNYEQLINNQLINHQRQYDRRLSDSFLYSRDGPHQQHQQHLLQHLGQRSPSAGHLINNDHNYMAPPMDHLVTSSGHHGHGHPVENISVRPAYDPMYGHPVTQGHLQQHHLGHRQQQLNQVPGLIHHPRFIYSDPDLRLASSSNRHMMTGGSHVGPQIGHHNVTTGQPNPYHQQHQQQILHQQTLTPNYPPEPSFADQMLLDNHQLIEPPNITSGTNMYQHHQHGLSNLLASPHMSASNLASHQQMSSSGGRLTPLSRPMSRSMNLIAPDHIPSTLPSCSCCPESSHLNCIRRFPSHSEVTKPTFLNPNYNLIDKYDYNYDNYYKRNRDLITKPYWTSNLPPSSRPVTPADINTSPNILTSKYVDFDDPKVAFKNQMKYFVQERKQALGGGGATMSNTGYPGASLYPNQYNMTTTAGLLGQTQTGSESDLNALLHLYSHPPDPVKDKYPPPGVPTYQSIPQAMLSADQNVHNPGLSSAAMNLINPSSIKHHHHHLAAAAHGHGGHHGHQVHWKDGGPTIDYI